MQKDFVSAGNAPPGPAWASALGAVIILFGLLLTASHSNEWLTQQVVGPQQALSEVPEADCPEDELEEEGISVAECQQMVAHVQSLKISRPDWYRGFAMMLAAVGLLFAFASILVGAALVNYRAWAPAAALVVIGGLGVIDLLQFIAVINSGPLVRQMYLWNILLWISIHVTMMVALFACRANDPSSAISRRAQ